MLRIVSLAILPGMLLVACASWVSADAAKQKYSNRPVGYTVPTPYFGTPMAPRFVVPPVGQVRVQVPRRIETVDAPGIASVGVVPPAPQVGDKTVFILREPLPEVNTNDELDAFYARMAKIQLEKHQLAEALALVQNIKSETFKVKTVVNLAEYVSRDKNYQSEADQLYRLALAGIDALDKKQPFRIDTSGTRVIAPPVVDREPVLDSVVPPPVSVPVPIDDITSQSPPIFESQQPIVSPEPENILAPNNDVGQNGTNGRRLPPPPPPPDEGGGGGTSNDGIVISPPGNKTITPIEMFEDNGLTPLPPKPPIATPNIDPTSPESSNGKTTETITSPNIVRPSIVIPLDDDPDEAEANPLVVDPKPEEAVEEPPKPPTGSGQRRQRPIIILDN